MSAEVEAAGFPVMGPDAEGNAQQIGVITLDELEIINRSRGQNIEPTGIRVVEKEIKKEDIKLNLKDFQMFEFPVEEMEWQKIFGRVKKIVWKKKEPSKRIYYQKGGAVFLEDLITGKWFTYTIEETHPKPDEIMDYEVLKIAYEKFLEEYDVEQVITGEGTQVTNPKIIDEWTNTQKLDVLSNISEEQRTNFVIARWIAVVIWMPAILNRINGYLKLGHSVKGSLINKQGEALTKTPRIYEEEEESGGLLSSKKKKR